MGSNDAAGAIEELGQYLAQMTEWRRHFHAHPETAFEEVGTARYVSERLRAFGVDEVHEGLARTGVVGVIRAGSGPRAIGLRADMDALPIEEETNLPHRSKTSGTMHACGHDGHTAMLLGAAKHLAATRDFDGTVIVIFQPAEEGGAGGKAMVEDGMMDRWGIQEVYGMHNMPGIAPGHISLKRGPIMAAADQFTIEIEGKGAHAAAPHLGIDPVLIGAHIITALQSIASRNADPIEPAVLSVTKFHSGSAWNVIPHEAVLGGTVRAFDTQVQAQIEARMRTLCEGTALAHGARIDMRYERRYPPTVNHAGPAALCERVARALVGESNLILDPRPAMGSEDFAWMLQNKPGCYVWIGNGTGSAGGCMVHNPGYDFNDAILPTGAAYWVRLAETALAPG
jgi:amidohydrolase